MAVTVAMLYALGVRESLPRTARAQPGPHAEMPGGRAVHTHSAAPAFKRERALESAATALDEGEVSIALHRNLSFSILEKSSSGSWCSPGSSVETLASQAALRAGTSLRSLLFSLVSV